MPLPQMNVIVPYEALLQVKDTILHEMLLLVNATTNASMSSDEQHHAARDVSRLHETWPPKMNVLPHNVPRQLAPVHSAEEGSTEAVEDDVRCRRGHAPQDATEDD
jgi:hypothetical protein